LLFVLAEAEEAEEEAPALVVLAAPVLSAFPSVLLFSVLLLVLLLLALLLALFDLGFKGFLQEVQVVSTMYTGENVIGCG
jgi:hypothetical protein